MLSEEEFRILNIMQPDAMPEGIKEIDEPTLNQKLGRALYNLVSGKPIHPLIYKDGTWALPNWKPVDKDIMLSNSDEIIGEFPLVYLLDMKIPENPLVGETSIFGTILGQTRIVDFTGSFEGLEIKSEYLDMTRAYEGLFVFEDSIRRINRMYRSREKNIEALEGILQIEEDREKLRGFRERFEELSKTYLK